MIRSLWTHASRAWQGISPRARRLALSLVLSQAGWFACVLGAAHGWAGAGMALATAALAGMLWCSSAPARDATLMLLAMVAGLVWDSGLGAAGVVVYASPGPLAPVAPLWILLLWALLGGLLREPLAWLHGRWALAALLGGVGGALSYASAVRLGAGLIPDMTWAMVVLGLGWAVLTPLLLLAARALEQGKAVLEERAGRPG